MVLILSAALCFSSLDNSVRQAGRLLPVLLILWLRYLMQALLMGAWLLRSVRGRPGGAPDWRRFRSAHPRFQLVRGALLLATSGFSFVAVQHMPVAEFTAINMLAPVLVTLLAAWLLGEQVSPLRWVLVVGAFIGALIVMRPGSGLFGWAVLLPLGGAVTYASFQVLTSKLSAIEDPITTHFYTGLIGSVLLTALVAVNQASGALHAGHDLAAIGAGLWALLVLIGVLGTVGHLLLILALGCAPASRLVPFMYAQIAGAAAIGWLMFGDLPDAYGWLGMAVIALCGAATTWLNVRSSATRAAPLAADPAAE
ncbi:MAG: DMT family transporter [Leptothrix sp. (in: b-proteobacteria)]